MDAARVQTLEKFLGINNVDSATRIKPEILDREYHLYQLTQASNVDIDNSYAIVSRKGYTLQVSGNIHSLWSNGSVCLFVEDGTLYRMGVDFTKSVLRSGLSNHRMSYTSFNDRVYYCNGFQIGYVVDDVSHDLVDPILDFKMPLPAGNFVELYNACLLVAHKNILYVSDPLCDYYDIRTGYKLFASDIQMVRAVDAGVYVSDDVVWFMKGGGNDDFSREIAYESPAIPFTDIRVDGQYIASGMEGDVAIWTSKNGICVGSAQGNVTNLTEERYTFSPTTEGSAFIRDTNNVRHYINSLY